MLISTKPKNITKTENQNSYWTTFSSVVFPVTSNNSSIETIKKVRIIVPTGPLKSKFASDDLNPLSSINFGLK